MHGVLFFSSNFFIYTVRLFHTRVIYNVHLFIRYFAREKYGKKKGKPSGKIELVQEKQRNGEFYL